MTDRIHLSRAHVTQVEEDLVIEALRSGWVAPLGPMVDRFEAEMAQRVGVRAAVALASGTAALHLALLHCGAAPGRVVLLPSLTFAATANAVRYTGATPVFLDSLAVDGNLDPQVLAERREVLRLADVALFAHGPQHRLVEALEPLDGAGPRVGLFVDPLLLRLRLAFETHDVAATRDEGLERGQEVERQRKRGRVSEEVSHRRGTERIERGTIAEALFRRAAATWRSTTRAEP